MGQAIAARLARSGWKIAIADLPGVRLDDCLALLSPDCPDALGIEIDIRQPADCARAVAATVAHFGRLDALVNAAGVWREGPATSVTEDDWAIVMDVNLKGPFFMAQAAIPQLSDGGSILNIASDAGLVGNTGAAVYSASKGGLVLLTKALALELAPRRIRVNALCPADVATPMIEFQASAYGEGDPDAYKARLLSHYPQGPAARFIRSDEIAAYVAFVLGDEATAITGAALSIDFGVTAGY